MSCHDLVERYYNNFKPVMGAPDDTDGGHGAAFAAAKVKAARVVLRWWDDRHVDHQVFISHLRRVLNSERP